MKMTTTPPASWTGNLFRRPPLGVYTVTGSPEDALRRCLDLWVTIGVREQTHGMPQQFARRGWVGTEITVDASSRATEKPFLGLPDLMGAVSDVVSGTGTILHMAYEETVPEGLRAVTDTVGEVASFVGSAAREAAGGVVDTVGEVAGSVGEVAGSVGGAVAEVAGGVVDAVVESTGTVGEGAGFVGSAAREAAVGVVDTVGGLVSGFAAKAWRKERLPKPGKCRIVVAARTLPDQEKEAAQLWCFLTDEVTKRAFQSDDQIDEAFQWLERKLAEQNILLDVPHYVNQNDLPNDSILRADSLAKMRRSANTEIRP